MIHKIAHFAAWTLNNPYTLAPMCMALVFVPIIGMHLVHKYGWEHWAPFDRGHKQGYNQYIRDWNASWLTSPREKRIGTPTHVREKWDPSRCPSVLFCRISLTHSLRGVAQFGRALALGASGRRFKSFHPDCLNMTTMEFYSVEYWQENWETLMDRVENGETIGVENENGDRAVMTPADDELIRMYTDHSEAS